MLWTLSAIAFFILLMAIVNFINICIGRSSERMKEMGIRKVLGGLRQQLIWQFITESVLVVVISTFLAWGIYIIARPYFSSILGNSMWGIWDFPVYFILLSFLFAIFIGFIAGIYPALVLSALKSVDSLKGKFAPLGSNVIFQKFLVGFQFFVAAIVLVGAIIISQQVDLFFSSNLGYNKDYVLYARVPKDWSKEGVDKMEADRYQIAQMPQVRNISLSFSIPDGETVNASQAWRQGDNPLNTVSMQVLPVDNQFADTYSIPVRAGDFFKPFYRASDASQIVLSETASKAFGWLDPRDAIGRKVMIDSVAYTVCGVTADFHFSSMLVKIKPLAFLNVNASLFYRYFSFRLRAGDIQKNISILQKKWSDVLPGAPFEYHFMDEALDRLYATELRLKKAAYIATVLAIVIAMLGILGLVSLSIHKRTKEIGIRKVLGASTAKISGLFLKDFLGLIMIAVVAACAPAVLILHSWLNGYAYRISVTPMPFAISIAFLTVVTSLLIVLQTASAASSNPIRSIRTSE